MISALIRFSLIQRLMILLLTGALVLAGIWTFRNLPIDAFPNISSPQVQVIVKAPGLSPNEVESRITFPIETELQGLPGTTMLRSTTKFALTNIVLDFEDGTDVYWARQQVSERLNLVWGELPEGIEGGLAPISTPLSDIYMYRIEGEKYDDRELRSIQDWVIRPRLRTVEGVADVNSLGGLVKTYEVIPKPAALNEYGLGLDEIEQALLSNNRNAGGDRINRDTDMILIRTVGQLQKPEDIENITVAVRAGTPVRIKDLAHVEVGSLTRYGGVTADGKGEVVTGLVLLRSGANSRSTIEGIKKALAEVESSLPEGVTIVPFYDRSDLINSAIATVQASLGEAVILVLLVLVILLGNLRTALTVALILPLSVLFTFTLMYLFNVSANLMSLGGLAIAIGILVDAAVVVVENIHTQLSHEKNRLNKLHLVYRATREVAVPVISGVLIIIIVFLPLFSLTGLEGKMFTPLATTISFALIGSLLLSLTVIPVLASLLMKGGHEDDGRVLGSLKRAYRPVMHWALNYRLVAVSGAVLLLVVSLFLFTRIGREFIPVMDEGTPIVNLEKHSSISLEHSLAMDAPIQQAMMEIPEVVSIVARSGADELRLDPMGFYQTDSFLITKPREEWTITQEEFYQKLEEKLEKFEGVEFGFSQPIDMRVSEMLTGVRADVAIKIFGDDFAVLEEKSQQIEEILSKIEGATEVFRGRLSGQGYLQVDIRHDAIARYGLSVEAVNQMVEAAVAGKQITEIVEGSKRTPVVLRYPESARQSPEAIGNLLIETPQGNKVPLKLLANIHEVDGPVLITRESARRLIVIRSSVEGRDIVGFVDELKKAIEEQVELPQGYYINYGGQFESQQHASARLAIVVPVSIALIFLMLFSTFRSFQQAGLIILNIPFAMIGGIISLYLSGLYLSVPASIGFITLFGVAVLNGVVMVSYFNQLRAAGRSIMEAVQEGAERRLRPVLMTALIASLGLVPMLMAEGPGSELQQPLAVVVIGGLVTSTLLTLVLLPTLYVWLESRSERIANQQEKLS